MLASELVQLATSKQSAFKRMLRRIKAYTGGVNYY